MSLSPGARLGAYEVVARIAAGGMGEVYRARDTRLQRYVALKILPEAFATDPDRLARFKREAQVLASLNHPNIGGIHGLEESNGMQALVLELVDGQTLADRIKQGPIPFGEALSLAKQIAEALETAHDHGIIHRDLKPSNIKLRSDGTVKVLDFGLAKALDPSPASNDLSDSPTITSPAMTRLGVILGTASYMAPEQAKGKLVDKRVDIWAFGCVFYEMLTGKRAFPGEDVSEVLASVLMREPDWTKLPPETPTSVRNLIRRCLEKDPKRRLRDIGDARIEFEDAVVGSPLPTPAPTISPRHYRRGLAWPVAGVLFIALAVQAWSGGFMRPGPSSGSPPTFSRIVRLTSGPASESAPAISPDGKWVAYLSDARGVSDVWVKFVAGGDPVNLTASSGLEITNGTAQGGLEISPDGTRIAVIARPRGGSEGFNTWEIPAPLPGVARKLLDGNVAVRWSPDGRQITFMRAGGLAGDALFVADADGTNPREIVKARDGMHNHWPAWSRDGYVYFIHTVSTVLANAEPAQIFRVDPGSGSMEPVVLTTRRAVFPLPMPDGNGLIYAANPTSADLSLWWRPSNGGQPLRLTTGIGEYAEPRISADGKTLVCTLYDVRQSLNRVALTPGQAAQLVPMMTGHGGDLEPSFAPKEDRMVFTSTRSGNRHLWTARTDGSDARPLTSGPSLDDHPAFSPDGQQIAFVSDRGGRRAIWTINPAGGAPRKLADVDALDGTLTWSFDGSQIVYAAGAGDFPGLWTVSIADGQVKRFSTPGPAIQPALSPTGNLIAYMFPSTSRPQVTRLAFIDRTGKPVYSTLPRPPGPGGFANGMPAWSPDGRRLAVLSQPASSPSSIWIVDPENPNPYSLLIELPAGPRIRGLSWTRDGSAVIVGKHETSSDIVLLDQGQ